MAEHSPAPWEFERGGGHASSRIVGADIIQVAGPPESETRLSGRSYSERVCDIPDECEQPQVAANISLIIAAPELLAACNSASILLAFIPSATEHQRALLQDVYDDCMAAVKKAKGHTYDRGKLGSTNTDEVARWLFDEAECTLRLASHVKGNQWFVEDAHGNEVASGATVVEAIHAGEQYMVQHV